jgi:hypothetical protein
MNPKTIDYAPTKHYCQHQRIRTDNLSRIILKASDFAPDSFNERDSLLSAPIKLNWPVLLGWGFGIVFGLTFYYVIGRLLGIVG